MRKIKSSKIFLVVLVIASFFAVSGAVLFTKDSRAGMLDKTVVKLYSVGQVVATWEAIDIGEIDGNSVVFTIDRNKNTKVRICGTYSLAAQ